jgi:hypothetical protein
MEWWYALGSVASANELHPYPTATLELGLDTFGDVTARTSTHDASKSAFWFPETIVPQSCTLTALCDALFGALGVSAPITTRPPASVALSTTTYCR